MKFFSTFVLLMLIPIASVQAQKTTQGADELYGYKPIPPAHFDIRWLIDTPTAYMLPRGSFDLDFKTFPQGGVQAAIDIGLARRFQLGLGYGGAHILSEETPSWNPKMEFRLRYMLVDENFGFPQVAVGFSSMGYGLYQEKDSSIGYYEDRYLTKSMGFYMTASKRYPIYTSYVVLNGGINYSLENDIDSDPNIFIGSLTNLGYNMLFTAEYDFAINDNKRAGNFGIGRGYLNVGLSWFITNELQLEVDFRNLLLNREDVFNKDLVIDREVRLVYLQFFTD